MASIDPGMTTGLAFRLNGDLHTCVVTDEHEIFDLIEGMEQVVIERFQTAGRLSAPGLITIELVGSVRGWCYAKGIPLTMQFPVDRYPFMREAQRAIGTVIQPSKWAKHEVDALAHLLTWEYKHA